MWKIQEFFSYSHINGRSHSPVADGRLALEPTVERPVVALVEGRLAPVLPEDVPEVVGARLIVTLPEDVPKVEYTAEGFGRLLVLLPDGRLLVLLPDGRLTLVAGRLVLVPVGRTLEGELIPLDGLP